MLEALPHAGAYVSQDGTILVQNGLFDAVCADLGIEPLPGNLSELLSAKSWKRCVKVLAAAFSGIPAEVSGAITLKSGRIFCHHMVCTTYVSLTAERSAVLVQFEQSGNDELSSVRPKSGASQLKPGGISAESEEALPSLPDDVLVFDGSESNEEKAIMLLEVINSDHDLGALIELLAACKADQSTSLHISQCDEGKMGAGCKATQMCEVRLIPLPDKAGEKTANSATLAVIRRNVDSPEEVAENRRLAYQDSLTGLENRRAFTKALTVEMVRTQVEGEAGLAVYYIDLDEFKKVNDLGGHDAGDTMLQRVASSLRLALGEFGTAARIGGDEFACMMPVADRNAAQDVAEKILENFDRIRLEIADRVFTIGGSIGVAYVESGRLLEKVDARLLLGLADRACLRGKRSGGRSIQLHVVRTEDHSSAGSDQMELPDPHSFKGNELALISTPIVCLKQGRACGLEVQLHLRGKPGGTLSHRAWISAAERYGYMAQADTWTLEKVLDAAEREASSSVIAMKISAASAKDPNFRDGLFDRLSANQPLASKLCLEVAERDFLSDPATVEAFFSLAADLGCRTALDDFAGHWPVLFRLTDMKVEWLKLEPGLTRQAVQDPSKGAILSGLVSTAHQLGIRVVAKDVATVEEAKILENLNVDAAQGTLFGKPESLIDFG